MSQNDTIADENEISTITENNINDTSSVSNSTIIDDNNNAEDEEEEEEEEHVREMIEVNLKKKFIIIQSTNIPFFLNNEENGTSLNSTVPFQFLLAHCTLFCKLEYVSVNASS